MRCRQDLLALAALAAGILAVLSPPPQPVTTEPDGGGAAAAEAPPPAPDAERLPAGDSVPLHLRSQVALVQDEREGVVLYDRHADTPRPIASLTKLMTALVILEAGQPLDEPIEITPADHDHLKGSRSRLRFGTVLTRRDLLHAALAASDNRAAAALARRYPDGREALVAAMNARAQALGMSQTRFTDPTGLDDGNVSTARDLARLLAAAERWALIRTFSTSPDFRVTDLATGREIAFYNTNRLVRSTDWDIALSKTGYTARAGNCLAMRVAIGGRPLTIVLLNSRGKLSKYGDARRIRHWLDRSEQYMALLSANRAERAR